MTTEVQNDNTLSQTDSSEPTKNDNNMLNDLLSSILSQSVRTRKTKSPKDSKVEKNDNEENDSEENDSEENDSEENDSEESDSDSNELISDENDLRWVALSKLLDSHLYITKSFLHLVREE